MSFKFELWEIENGVVITRPVKVGTDADGQDVYKNGSLYREDPLVAVKEVQVALDDVKAHFQKSLSRQPSKK